MKSLLYLIVYKTGVTEKVRRKLSDALPKCQIDLGDGKMIGPKDESVAPRVNDDPDDE